MGTTCFLAFIRWGASTFTKEQLIKWILGLKEENASTRATRNSLKGMLMYLLEFMSA